MIDVVIAGGGPSALAAATALAERGASVVVVDAAGGVSAQRGELLPQGAADIMDRLGLADDLKSALVIDDVVSRWGGANLQSHGAHPTLGFHGWGIDRYMLSRAMLRRAQTLGVQVLTARATGYDKTANGWRIAVSGTQTLDARYLIDATGRPASIARRHGSTLLQGPDLVALTWQTTNSAHAHMQSEATPDGWWYMVPHANGGTVGFMTSAQHAKNINRAPAEFLTAAQNELSLVSLDGASNGPRMMDSRSSVLDQMCGAGWLAAGDAAAAFDPIASQGLFNALSGGFFAGQAAADAIAGDEDASRVYEALAVRTAERTFSMTHLQYAALPYDTDFWRQRGDPGAA